MPTQTLVTDGVMRIDTDGPVLIGSRCADCDTHAFPAQDGCQRCSGTNTEEIDLGRRGTLWTWTVQGFPPKAPPYRGNTDPSTFSAYGVGYVELPNQVKVEARLTEADPAKLQIGMELEIVLETLAVDADGNETVTFAFRPV